MASPSRPTRVSSPLLLGLGFLIALIAFALQFYIRKHLRPLSSLGVFGSFDMRKKIDSFLCCSSVFDVTKGKTHYGPGGGYHHFAGRFVHFMILSYSYVS
ncbi:hypothetical protein BHM03_00003144 [Ensete ventricosum]|nr:hypothetical protein BHM03_00003144 [Ensete ventricosum]